MSLDSFIKKYLNKGVDFDGYYGFQCTDLARQYIKDVLNQPQPKGVTGAKDFWTNYETDPNLNKFFAKIPNTPTGIPKRGDIMIWGASYGQFGHIAIVNSADVNQFQALSQNDPLGSKTILKNYNYNSILGWFSPKKENMSDYEEAIRKSVAYDEVCKVLGVPSSTSKDEMSTKLSKLLSDKERYQKERNEARTERDNYVKTITEQNKQITNLQKDITELNNDLENCKNEIPEVGDLEKDWQATGQKIIKTTGDTIIETSYKRKE